MGRQTAQPNRSSGSATATQPALRLNAPSGTLRLRAEPAEQRHIQWAEDVVDNEGMGKKSSKGLYKQEYIRRLMLIGELVCCIYHKPREVGESSDESSSDSSSDDSDSEPDNGEARPAGGRKGGDGRRGRRPHNHEHNHDHGEHDHDEPNGGPSQPQKRPRRRPSPNAYEKMPKQKK